MARSDHVSYEFACQHLYPECDTRIKGESREDLLDKAKRHVSEHHGVRDYQDEVVRRLRTAIRPA